MRFDNTGAWEGEVALYEKPPGQASIIVAEVGESGHVLVDYYRRAGEATGAWLPLRNLTSDILIYDRVRIRKRGG